MGLGLLGVGLCVSLVALHVGVSLLDVRGNGGAPVVIFEAEGRIITINPAVAELLGYSAEELAGRSPEIFHPEDIGKVRAALALTAAERKRIDVVARVITKSGETRDFLHSLTPVVRNNEVRSIVGVIRDAAGASRGFGP